MIKRFRRRSPEKRIKTFLYRKIRLFIIWAFICVATPAVLFLATGAYFYNFALSRSVPKSSVFAAQDNSGIACSPFSATSSVEKNILKEGVRVSLKSFDGLNLSALEIKSSKTSSRWVLIVHGYAQNGLSMTEATSRFLSAGFNVLLPDLRGHGESEGSYIGMGWHDRKDIVSWARFITSKYPDSSMVLYGVSMGAAAVMMAIGESLPENVKCAVEDSGYSSVWEEFVYQLKKIYRLPPFPALYAADYITRLRAGYDFKTASAVNQLRKTEVPVLFIHGEKDTFVPYEMLEKVYDACESPKTKISFPNAGHVESYKIAPDLYWKTVFSFVEKYVQT